MHKTKLIKGTRSIVRKKVPVFFGGGGGGGGGGFILIIVNNFLYLFLTIEVYTGRCRKEAISVLYIWLS